MNNTPKQGISPSPDIRSWIVEKYVRLNDYRNSPMVQFFYNYIPNF